ncbi:flavodoxin domain-containing protein [Vallicoccus soli]|uniref:Flavodoxin n=1 Tax=Vallicoccus soli TaxID=2339232 RepID=A0A3A3ZM55_9ACTN|nr:flavodoxin domain-containing protein [Vallicoccus soli]RJK97621.1 flavodoxin [Vallicoccus soli]
MHPTPPRAPAGARVLVSVASKHGATAEIGERVAQVLRTGGHDVDLVRPDDVGAVDGYDAVVLGSAVYAGHWLAPARALALRLSAQLVLRPVWLFSSGPVGDPPYPVGEPVDVERVLASTAARDHRVLPGRVERARLSFAERAVLRALRAPEGDFRDWAQVEDWAAGIGRALAPSRVG